MLCVDGFTSSVASDLTEKIRDCLKHKTFETSTMSRDLNSAAWQAEPGQQDQTSTLNKTSQESSFLGEKTKNFDKYFVAKGAKNRNK